MAGSTIKKVLVRRFDRETLHGFVNPEGFLQGVGVEILSPSGSITFAPYVEVKSVCFVKDFQCETEPAKVFNTRPKMNGLWVRMTFRDKDVMDGVLSNNLIEWAKEGYLVVPPESYSNNQKVFVPRMALTKINVLGVMGSPLARTRKDVPVPKEQGKLFE